jgi:hypothetical protein
MEIEDPQDRRIAHGSSHLRLQTRGIHALKTVPAEWRLYALAA